MDVAEGAGVGVGVKVGSGVYVAVRTGTGVSAGICVGSGTGDGSSVGSGATKGSSVGILFRSISTIPLVRFASSDCSVSIIMLPRGALYSIATTEE